MYIEASAPRTSQDEARLTSPDFDSSQAKCLTFYYHMYGNQMGTLSVRMKVSNYLLLSIIIILESIVQ